MTIFTSLCGERSCKVVLETQKAVKMCEAYLWSTHHLRHKCSQLFLCWWKLKWLPSIILTAERSSLDNDIFEISTKRARLRCGSSGLLVFTLYCPCLNFTSESFVRVSACGRMCVFVCVRQENVHMGLGVLACAWVGNAADRQLQVSWALCGD